MSTRLVNWIVPAAILAAAALFLWDFKSDRLPRPKTGEPIPATMVYPPGKNIVFHEFYHPVFGLQRLKEFRMPGVRCYQDGGGSLFCFRVDIDEAVPGTPKIKD